MTVSLTRTLMDLLENLSRDLLLRLALEWGILDLKDIDGTRRMWALLAAQALDEYDIEAWELADAFYVTSAAQQGADPVPKRRYRPGRPATDLLELLGPIGVKQRVGAGMQVTEAGRRALSQVMTGSATRLQSSFDSGLAELTLVDERIVGWRRVVSPSACSRCQALKGRMYKVYTASHDLYAVDKAIAGQRVQGFPRHPNCHCGTEPVWLDGTSIYDYNRRGRSVVVKDAVWDMTPDFTRYAELRRTARYWNVPVSKSFREADAQYLTDLRSQLLEYERRARPDAQSLRRVTLASIAGQN